jgi:hypothetical protein
VTIFIGTTASKQISATPTNVVIDQTGAGKVFFGSNSITASAPPNTVNAHGANVVFSKPANAGTAITLGGGVTITADPPVGSPNPPQVPTVTSSQTTSTTAATHGGALHNGIPVSIVPEGFFAPSADRVIQTINGEVNIKAGSLVFITTRDGTTSIFNLSWKGGVTVNTGSGSASVLPGRAMVVSTQQSMELNALLRSKDAAQRKLARSVMKTAAAVMVMRQRGLSPANLSSP